MCTLPEYNPVACTQNQLLKPTLLNMAFIHSLNCASDQLSCECVNETVKAPVEASNISSNSTSVMNETSNVFAQNANGKKSLYKSKECKYSFLASDYTSPEGQKLLSTPICQRTLEVDCPNTKEKNCLPKRSISEYFLSKNNPELQDEKGKDSLIKSLQRTFSKTQSVMPQHVEEFSDCDMTFVPDYKMESAALNGSVRDQHSLKSCYSLHQHKLGALDIEPGSSDCAESRQSLPEEDKFVHRNSNLNPNVNFNIFDIESLSEAGEPCDSVSQENNANFSMEDSWFIPSARHTFSGADISGSASATQLSIASSFGDSSLPTCKICHTAAKPEDPLISPCRCTGTLRYIHCGCLMKWLEICTKRSRKPTTCELCKYQFHWHKKFKFGRWQFPHCSWQDKILHTVFIIAVMIMIGCAAVTVMCFNQHRGVKTENSHLELTQSEIVTLVCGALFFFAFFLAMYVEIKARNTIYKLLHKFIYLNQQWYIDEYDKKKENSAIDV